MIEQLIVKNVQGVFEKYRDWNSMNQERNEQGYFYTERLEKIELTTLLERRMRCDLI